MPVLGDPSDRTTTVYARAADDQGSGTTTATDDGDTDGASGDENDVAGTDTPESGDAVAATIAHRVERGDTLIAIGAQYGVDWQLIAQLNQITDPNVIGVGRVLQVPNPDATGEVTLPAQTTDLEALFDSWAESTGVPTELLQAVAWYESEWDPTLLGPAGELGIGQLLPEVHTFVERDLAQRTLDPSVPADSVEAMARYLGWLLTETQGDTSATLAAYHQGLLSQRNIGWNDDTIAYIAAVVSLRPQFVDRA